MRYVCLLLLLAACAPAAPELHLQLTNVDAMPGWHQDRQAAALAAFRRSCKKMLAQPEEAVIGKGKLRATSADWKSVCRAALRTGPKGARNFFETRFTPFAVAGDGLFTGYYEPLLHGARHRHGRYQIPVYALPPDVQPGVAYYSRAEIDAGALAHRGLELLWVDDPVMLFFAQIQGSARVHMERGHTVRLGFAGKNNQPYVAIGKVLKQSGDLSEINFFTLRGWLYAHPARAAHIMEQNPSYVFFKTQPDTGGPLGAQGVPLLPARSLAVDARVIPYGMPLFVQTALPDGKGFNRLMVAQDAGGAIKGAVRGDIFFGAGSRAEQQAGLMQSRGGYVLLIPNSIAAGL